MHVLIEEETGSKSQILSDQTLGAEEGRARTRERVIEFQNNNTRPIFIQA